MYDRHKRIHTQVILDLALNMIRNLLQVDAPRDARGERVPLPARLKARLHTAQDTLLLKFAEENVLELLILLAQVSGDLASVVVVVVGGGGAFRRGAFGREPHSAHHRVWCCVCWHPLSPVPCHVSYFSLQGTS
jgi:hypothetical protein